MKSLIKLQKRKWLAVPILGLIFLSFQNCSNSTYSVNQKVVEAQYASLATNPGDGDTNLPPTTPLTCEAPTHLDASLNECVSNTQLCTVQNGSGAKIWSNQQWGPCEIQSCDFGFHKENNLCASNQRNCQLTQGTGVQDWNGTTWGSCEVSACQANFHIENSSCVSNIKNCTVSNGSGTQTWNGVNYGTCQVNSCLTNFHIENNLCAANTRTCSAGGGTGTQAWVNGAWGACIVSSCPLNSHVEGNTCVSNTRTCNVTNGFGTQNWSGTSWSTCTTTSCFNNYHIEQSACLEDVRSCTTVAGLKGTQGYSGSAWSSCVSCQDGYTSFGGVCYQNDWVNRELASYLPKCWTKGFITCASQSVNAFIGLPNVDSANSSTVITFKIKYNHAAKISLASSHIRFAGTATSGCSATISGNGAEDRYVQIQGCNGIGTMRFTINAGSAADNLGHTLGEIGPSTDVMIANLGGLAKVSYTSAAKSYVGKNGNTIRYEISYPSNYASRTNIPIMIWIHGGAWAFGDYADDRPIAQAFAEMGFIVVNTNYSLDTRINLADYPTPILPTSSYVGPEDINNLVNVLRADAALSTTYHGDKSKISIAGASAGGHLSVMQSVHPSNQLTFKCVIDVAGVTNLTSLHDSKSYPASAWIVRSVFGDNKTFLNQYSPTYNIANFKGSKLAIFHQNQDNLVPIDHALQLANAFKTQFPSKELVLNYADDAVAPQPLYSPNMTQITHVYQGIEPIIELLKSYAYSSCQ